MLRQEAPSGNILDESRDDLGRWVPRREYPRLRKLPSAKTTQPMQTPGTPQRRARRTSARRPLQPQRAGFSSEGDNDRDFLGDLASRETTEEARRVQRLWDQGIVLDLQLRGYDTSTPEWVEFATAMAEYGYSVLKGWLISGTLYRMAASHGNGQGVNGLGKIPDTLRLAGDDAHTLATDVLIVSIDQFRSKTLMHPRPEKRWNPTGGASLKTFFVGRCLMEFPDCYVKWHRQETRIHVELGRYAALDDTDRLRHVDLEEAATGSATVGEVFAEVDPLVRVMFELQDEGYSYNEIAEMLTGAGHPTSPATVRTNMSRLRKAARGARKW